MKYFITGVTGLVGSYIAREILRQGGFIQAIKRSNSNLLFIEDIQNQIHWIDGNILDTELLIESIKKVDYVIHSAGLISFEEGKRWQLIQTNVEGTANLINACLYSNNIKKLCYISSVAVLNSFQSQVIVDEKTQWKPSKNSFSAYALSKYLAEQEVWRGIAEGLKVIIVNPSVVLGVSDWNKGSTQLFKFIWNNNKYYYKTYINYIDCEDVAKIVYKLLHSPIQGERFILNTGKINCLDFFTQVALLLKKYPPRWYISSFWLKILVRIGRIMYLFRINSSAFPSKEIYKEMLHNNWLYDNTKIRNFLQYTFKPLDKTLLDICPLILQKNKKK